MTYGELVHIAEYYFRNKIRSRCKFDKIIARDKLKVKGDKYYIFVGSFVCPSGKRRAHIVKMNQYGKVVK